MDTLSEQQPFEDANLGQVKPVDIESEMRTAYLDYAMSVIVSRALPDAADGLKPVHRRILYSMYDQGNRPGTQYRKSARIVGDVLGKYHPHSDSAVYDAMARMAQDFSLRYPLVDGQGNFGSVDGDNPAAMRYTEARMARITEEMLLDIHKDTVAWQENFDATLKEPRVLPARIPNMLLNGSSGIAVGMATNIPPHNLSELCDAVVYMIDNYDDLEAVDTEVMMQFVKGPDFPTGAMVLGGEDLVHTYATGKGAIVMRAVAEIEETTNNRFRIIITEIPYQVNKANLLIRMAELVKTGRLKDIVDLRDESDRNGMRIVVELKKGAQPRRVLNQLYKYTPLQSNFSLNMLALVNNEPRRLSLKMALKVFIDHRREVITRRTAFDLQKAQNRAHILEGLRIALNHLDDIINTIRQSESVEDARNQLMSRFSLSDVQAQAILDMQLRRLAALERQKIEDEYKEIMATIAHLKDLLANPHKILELVREDTLDVKNRYGDERRTQIIAGGNGEFNEEDLIKDEKVLITITRKGYIKRVPSRIYKRQGRGGRGVTGMTTRAEDDVAYLFAANTHNVILFFSDSGKVYADKAWRIPDASRTAKGTPLVNLININPGEKITATIAVDSFENANFLVMATKHGRIKRTDIQEYASVRPSGLIAIALDDDDELRWVKMTDGQNDLIVATHLGHSIRFPETDVRAVGRSAGGVNAIKLVPDDFLAGMDVVNPDDDLLVITANGMGKRTPLSKYNRQGRYGSGSRTLDNVLEITGPIMDMHVVKGEEDLFVITTEGKIIRIEVAEIPQMGRMTRGVRVVRLSGGDQVASVAVLIPDLEPSDEEAPEDGEAVNDDPATDSEDTTAIVEIDEDQSEVSDPETIE